ncbi:MAG TPA: hypothetical protein VFO31_20105 [Vicinamibacterales bacterium]|nr:hypothetical protein [Vicinamibacterales bacterium]
MKKHTLTRLAAVLLLLSLAMPASAQDTARDWTTLAASLAPGARVELDLADGTHVDGTVLAQEEGRFVFNPKTRIPVAPWRVDYSEIRSLEVKHAREGMRPGTKVLIGVGTGLGVLLLLAGIAVATAY